MVGRLIAVALAAVGLVPCAATRAQEAASLGGYDQLTAAQQRLLAGPPAAARAQYDAAAPAARADFARVTGALAGILLSDPENGEVLGSALELVESVTLPLPRPDAAAAEPRLAVVLAPGARDRLRRSREFERVPIEPPASAPIFEHPGPPTLRIAMSGPAGAIITVAAP